MPIFTTGGYPLSEAKRIQGQEYKNYMNRIATRGVMSADDLNSGDAEGITYGTTSLGKGGILDSVAQTHIEELDLDKEKAILESKDILKEYDLYISGNIKNIVDSFGQSLSNIESQINVDYQYLLAIGFDDSSVTKMIKDNYFGGSNIYRGMDIDPMNMDEEEINKASKALRTILRMRMNYVNKITNLMSSMLRKNYKILGISEAQASEYIKALQKGDNTSVKTAGEIKKLIAENYKKFVRNNGNAIDLREIGFGVILGPDKGYEINYANHEESNADGMLQLIQQAMRYDVVLISHGSDNNYRVKDSSRNDITHATNELEMHLNGYCDKMDRRYANSGINKTIADYQVEYTKFATDFNAALALFDYSEFTEFTNTIESFKKDMNSNLNENLDSVKNRLLKVTIQAANVIFNKIMDETPKLRESDFYKKFQNDLKGFLVNSIVRQTNAVAMSYIVDMVDIEEAENTWQCQPTRTLKAGPFEKVDDIVRQLIKEGYNKIMIMDCNPGGHKLADDIMKTKGVLINHSDFSNYMESTLIDSNDQIYMSVNELESSLIEFANEYGIDYNDNQYLTECMQWYLNAEYIEEGVIADRIKEVFKRIAGAIIGFIKSIISLVKKAFSKLRTLFVGTKDEPKNQTETFSEPIKTPLIDIKDRKIYKFESKTYGDLKDEADKVCKDMMDEIKKFNNTQQSSLKNMEKDIEELSRKENNIQKEGADMSSFYDDIFPDLFLEFETPDGPVDNEEEDTIDDNLDDEGTTASEPEGDDNAQDNKEDQPDADANNQDDPQEEDNDENFDLDDNEGENQNTEEQPEEQNDPEPEDNPEDENFDLPEDPDSEDGSADTGGEGDDSMDTKTGNTDGQDTDSSDSSEDSDSKLKELERVTFEELSDTEKKVKIKELKSLFISIHDKCKPIIDKVNEIQKDESTIQIVEYVSNSLIDLQKYITDYLTDIFDSKTYIENLAQCQKYIAVLNAINTIFEELRKENND